MKDYSKNVGILAYGSLISNPGEEIEAATIDRIETRTPFPVEFARISNGRRGAPTVVPHEYGQPVKATILVLKPEVSQKEAENMLWRREVDQVGSEEVYPAGAGRNAVQVRSHPKLDGVGRVLYTDFHAEGKIQKPNPEDLAMRAIGSVDHSDDRDGISYLSDLLENGVETSLANRYRDEILRMTQAQSLKEALEVKKIESQIARKRPRQEIS